MPGLSGFKSLNNLSLVLDSTGIFSFSVLQEYNNRLIQQNINNLVFTNLMLNFELKEEILIPVIYYYLYLIKLALQNY